MATSLLQVRVDENLKREASTIYENLGIDLSTAVRMFLKRSVLENGIPFAMKLPRTEYKSDRGLQALLEIGSDAEKNGTSEMSFDEINAEIEVVRERRLEAKAN